MYAAGKRPAKVHWAAHPGTLLAAVLVIRFVRTGGIPMLRMMNGGPDDDHAGHGEHAGHDHHAHHQAT